MVEDIEIKLEQLNNSWLDIQNNKSFLIIIENVLAIGNYMNGTSIRGGAFGFKLDTLEKLADLKFISNPKRNLLTHVIENYEEKNNKELISINTDLNDLSVAAKV